MGQGGSGQGKVERAELGRAGQGCRCRSAAAGWETLGAVRVPEVEARVPGGRGFRMRPKEACK